MDNIAWLESIAKKTDFDVEILEILKQQSLTIQTAYQSNNSTVLKNMFGKTDKLACKTTIFQY